MPTYVYETTDGRKPVMRFELKQSMRDEALRFHPDSGRPVRRVISGGFGYMGKAKAGAPPATAGGGCGSGGCGCC